MAMVDIRTMRMGVGEGPSRVGMDMGLESFPALVSVLVMGVVHVAVRVHARRVLVPVPVRLASQQPDGCRHQCSRHGEPRREGFVEDEDRAGDAKVRGEREVGARACRPQPPQGEDKQHQAGAVAHGAEPEPECHGGQARPR